MKDKGRFFIVIVVAHVIGYLVAGGISYQLITKELWAEPGTILSNYLRTPDNEVLWRFAMIWQIPAQFLRGALIGLVLTPLYVVQASWTKNKRLLFFGCLIFVLTHLGSSAPSPANIEGLVYIKPEFIKLGFFKMQVEMIFYSILFGLIVASYGVKSVKPGAAASL